MKKQVKYISAGMLAGMLLCGGQMQAANTMSGMHVCVTDAIQKDNRPEVSKRLFRSNAVEKEIIRVQKLLKNEKLAWMFANCFPNTIDTTVHFRKGADGKPDTFVYTGDIHGRVSDPATGDRINGMCSSFDGVDSVFRRKGSMGSPSVENCFERKNRRCLTGSSADRPRQIKYTGFL